MNVIIAKTKRDFMAEKERAMEKESHSSKRMYKRLWIRPIEDKGFLEALMIHKDWNETDGNENSDNYLETMGNTHAGRGQYPTSLTEAILYEAENADSHKQFNVTINNKNDSANGDISAKYRKIIIKLLRERLTCTKSKLNPTNNTAYDNNSYCYGKKIGKICTCRTEKRIIDVKPQEKSSHCVIKVEKGEKIETFNVTADKLTLVFEENDASLANIQVLARDSCGRIKLTDILEQKNKPNSELQMRGKTMDKSSEPGKMAGTLKTIETEKLPKTGILKKKSEPQPMLKDDIITLNEPNEQSSIVKDKNIASDSDVTEKKNVTSTLGDNTVDMSKKNEESLSKTKIEKIHRKGEKRYEKLKSLLSEKGSRRSSKKSTSKSSSKHKSLQKKSTADDDNKNKAVTNLTTPSKDALAKPDHENKKRRKRKIIKSKE